MYDRQPSGCLSLRGWVIVILALIALSTLPYMFGIFTDWRDWILVPIFAVFWSVVFFPIVIAWPSLAVGLLWAPFAALICARMAKSRGLDKRRYATVGAIYSILFFWPWAYLVARMRDKNVPSYFVKGTYIILYCVVWPLATLSAILPALMASPLRPFLLVVPLSAVTWFISLKNLLGLNKYEWRTDDDVDGMIPERVYIMPFAYAFIWTLFAGAAWAATYFVEVDSSSYSL